MLNEYASRLSSSRLTIGRFNSNDNARRSTCLQIKYKEDVPYVLKIGSSVEMSVKIVQRQGNTVRGEVERIDSEVRTFRSRSSTV